MGASKRKSRLAEGEGPQRKMEDPQHKNSLHQIKTPPAKNPSCTTGAGSSQAAVSRQKRTANCDGAMHIYRRCKPRNFAPKQQLPSCLAVPNLRPTPRHRTVCGIVTYGCGLFTPGQARLRPRRSSRAGEATDSVTESLCVYDVCVAWGVGLARCRVLLSSTLYGPAPVSYAAFISPMN